GRPQTWTSSRAGVVDAGDSATVRPRRQDASDATAATRDSSSAAPDSTIGNDESETSADVPVVAGVDSAWPFVVSVPWSAPLARSGAAAVRFSVGAGCSGSTDGSV